MKLQNRKVAKPRRDRKRCVHFDEGFCTITAPVPSCRNPLCIGPSKCVSYNERKPAAGEEATP